MIGENKNKKEIIASKKYKQKLAITTKGSAV